MQIDFNPSLTTIRKMKLINAMKKKKTYVQIAKEMGLSRGYVIMLNNYYRAHYFK